jgi:hypothetical protein
VIAARSFWDTAKRAGFSLYTGVPRSYGAAIGKAVSHISLKTRQGAPADLPRPTVTLGKVARRITKALGRTA